MRKPFFTMLCAGLLAAPLLCTGDNLLLLDALFRETSPEKRLALSIELLKNDPASMTAEQEIQSLLQQASPAERRQMTDTLLRYAESTPLPNALVWKIVSWSAQSGHSIGRCAALCRKAVERTPPPEPGAPEQNIQEYLHLLSSAAFTPPFALAEDAPRYQKVWLAAQDLPWAKGVCTDFFFTASRLAPQERRVFGLQQSEAEEYQSVYQTFFRHLAGGNNPERLLAMGFACRSGEPRQALALLRTLPRPDDPFAELLQYQLSGDYEGAVAWCRKCMQESRIPLPALQLKLASILFLQGEIQEAEELAELAYPAMPKETAQFLCLIRIAAGKGDSIAPLLDHLTPEEAFQIRVIYLTRCGRYPDAVQLGEDYLKQHPDSASVVLPALITPIQYGKLHDAARRLLEQARQIGMLDDPGKANDIAYVLCTLGIELEEAERLLEYAASHRPLDPPTLDSLAFLRFRQGKLQEAWTLINRALRLTTPDIEPFSRSEMLGHAADIALALGKKEDALRLYREAISLPVMPLTPSPRPAWQAKIDQLTFFSSGKRK